MFSNLHGHTDYSLHDALCTVPDLVSKAKELGYPALAITDHGTCTGLIDFYQECKKQEIKPILGCEFYLASEITVDGCDTYHLVILAKDINGYRNMMKLDTYAHEHFYRKPRISFEALEKWHEGLVCTTACVAGPLSASNAEEMYSHLLSIFGEDLYVELQPHNFQEQYEYNERWKNLGKTIITLDSHYVNKEDIPVHKLWLGLGDDSQYYASDDYYLRSEEEIVKWFEPYDIDVEKALKNVEEIVGKCNVEIEFGGQHYPVFCDDPATYIKKRCNEGFKKLGIGKLPNSDQYIEQVRHEFGVLSKLGYLNYFCIIDDMLKHCRECGIPMGLGRGSVVGSLTSYLMGITKLDPIKYNLVFERFANPERVTPPDIDSDVSTPKRQELIEYIKSKYGEVYQARTINYIQDKSAVQRAGEVLGIDPKVRIAKSKNIVNVEDMVAKTKEEKEWKALALKFKGHIISYGCHASAVLVCPEDVTNWTAIEKQKDNMVVCHDFHQLEAQGLLKLDILGLETLDIIEQTKHRAGIDSLNVANIPIDDKGTAEMLRRGNTSGCFQIESNVMTGIIVRMNVKSIEDMIAVVALGRPGPLDTGMVETFLRRRNHQEPTVYNIPELEPILKDTEGVIVYQEQIMQIAQKICGYSLGEADNLRRIIGRKIKEEMQPVIDDMIKRAVQNGYNKDAVMSLMNNIVAFSAYCFNRGHSAAYGMTAWVTAYLKCHYPAAFWASVIDANCKDKPKLASYIMEARKDGIKVFPPTLKHRNSFSDYDEDGPTITLGLNCIASVGQNEFPKDAPTDFKQFMEQFSSVNKKCLENMIKAGVFKGNRDEMLQYLVWAKDKRKSKGEFNYVPTEYNEQEEESKVLGISFGNIFQKYNMSIVNNVTVFGYEVLNIKARKTKTGKPMAFVKVRDNDYVKDLVIFNDKYKQLKAHKVYIMKVKNNRIFEFTEARPA